eukprot:TRINITY_DN18415_c0_g1_i8.p1 TRINITY_DN18415_c0_g1~~TRINITY_DN18415_c0_g1_i8.p1  ORF type:complete len:373 (-),score=59.84 TRINITY_DN18415_c0_g1_i8:69-1187(-)
MSDDYYYWRVREREKEKERARAKEKERNRPKDRFRDRSRTGTPARRHKRRRNSISPISHRKRHVGEREDPRQSKCLGIFGLSLFTNTQELQNAFSRFGQISHCEVVMDKKLKTSRGFGFVTFNDLQEAREAKKAMHNSDIEGKKIRVEFSITARAHTPTPGIYLGYPGAEIRRDGEYRRRRCSISPVRGQRYSPSPPTSPFHRYHRKRYHSRSPSISPRIRQTSRSIGRDRQSVRSNRHPDKSDRHPDKSDRHPDKSVGPQDKSDKRADESQVHQYVRYYDTCPSIEKSVKEDHRKSDKRHADQRRNKNENRGSNDRRSNGNRRSNDGKSKEKRGSEDARSNGKLRRRSDDGRKKEVRRSDDSRNREKRKDK